MGEELPHAHLLHFISVLVFIVVLILDYFVFKFSIGLSSVIPLWIRIILFLVVLTFALVLMGTAHKVLFGGLFYTEQHEPSTLVTTGVFAHVRHPMYLGILLIYLAFILVTMSIISIIPWILIIVLYDKMATYEEQSLEKIFAEEYSEYKNRVPKWIPRLSSSKKNNDKNPSNMT